MLRYMNIVDRPLGRRPRAAHTWLPAAASPSVPARDSTNELYDRACDLLVAAQGIRTAAARAGSAPAIAATLGCVEVALEALAHATAAMRREADAELARQDAGSLSGVSGADARLAFSELVCALDTAHHAADQLRERTGPLLARLTVPET
jgi:hypothetical protein